MKIFGIIWQCLFAESRVFASAQGVRRSLLCDEEKWRNSVRIFVAGSFGVGVYIEMVVEKIPVS